MAQQRIFFDDLTLNERYMVRVLSKFGFDILKPAGIGCLDYQTSRAILLSLEEKGLVMREKNSYYDGELVETWFLLSCVRG